MNIDEFIDLPAHNVNCFFHQINWTDEFMNESNKWIYWNKDNRWIHILTCTNYVNSFLHQIHGIDEFMIESNVWIHLKKIKITVQLTNTDEIEGIIECV